MEELTTGRSRNAWGGRWIRPPPASGKSLRLKITKVGKGEGDRVRLGVSKLTDPEIVNTLKLVLQNKFEGLQQLREEDELSVADEWRQTEQG